jgi:hypothetical protein
MPLGSPRLRRAVVDVAWQTSQLGIRQALVRAPRNRRNNPRIATQQVV